MGEQSPKHLGKNRVNFDDQVVPEATRGRFRDALHDPALQQTVLEISKGVGSQALKGAAEGSGLVKIGDDGRVKARKLGIAKAIVRPTHTLRKAVQGSISGARSGAIHETVHQARGLVHGDSLAPNSSSHDPFDTYVDRPQSTTATPVESGKKRLLGRSKKDIAGVPSVYPSPPPVIEDPWGTPSAYYPPSTQPPQAASEAGWGPFDTQPPIVQEATPSPRLGLKDRLLAGRNQRNFEQSAKLNAAFDAQNQREQTATDAAWAEFVAQHQQPK